MFPRCSNFEMYKPDKKSVRFPLVVAEAVPVGEFLVANLAGMLLLAVILLFLHLVEAEIERNKGKKSEKSNGPRRNMREI